jgi:ribonucleoside-triphosphate reductase (thioredoxin)
VSSASTSLLRDLVHYRTYATTLEGGHRETRAEVINRVKTMHQDRFGAHTDAIEKAFAFVHAEQVVPSMRTMQFAGEAMLRSHARGYNCAFTTLTSWRDFADVFWLLMNGVGAGFSVQSQHVSQLPAVSAGTDAKTYTIPDNKEGWADSIFWLLSNPAVRFVYSSIRERGSSLSTGGTASGPESLRVMHENIRALLRRAIGRKLTPIEAHDVMCLMADVVVVGGVRRAALISLFDRHDEKMMAAKLGTWWETHPYRARANNSAVILRTASTFSDDLRDVLGACFSSQCGEPGISLTNDPDYGFNPCHEISLRNGQLCNLSEVNAASCASPQEFYAAVESAAIIGTLQASYTDFPYLQPKWRENCERDALLGVSITGQAQVWPLLCQPGILRTAAHIAVETNRLWAKRLGIRPAARVTTTKPSGTTSAWLGTTSGIHAAHAEFFLRRVRVDRNDEFGRYFTNHFGVGDANSGSFIENDAFSPENVVITVPMRMTGSIRRNQESATALMDRAKHVYSNWILPGHVEGPNTHNVSLTVPYLPEEENEVLDWMRRNRDSWSGISLLPYNGGTYQQAPFEEITAEEFELRSISTPKVDFAGLRFAERAPDTEVIREMACAGGACEVQ